LENEVGEKMRQIGREFGATTGRPRRCGWLDIPALKYAIAINGVTELMMMKADILSDFETLEICTHYMHKGEKIDYLPYSIDPSDVTPVYETVKGWNVDLTKMTQKSELPKELIDYIQYIEKLVEVPISITSIGPDRTQTIFM
jgi:adenylosuccinate synthase